MHTVRVLIANVIWFLYSAWQSRRWKKASLDPQQAQQDVLDRILATNADTQYGKAHQFKDIRAVHDFQWNVPPNEYSDLKTHIDEIARGRKNILTKAEVRRFGITSGSAHASKLIPYTDGLIADFQEGIDPWMYYLMRSEPSLLLGKTYWSVTPVGWREKKTSAGIPIGFDDERSYFGLITRWVFDSIMIVPSELAQIKDIEIFRYATLRFLIQEKNLRWISVWNPTFLSLLLEPLESWLEELIEDIGKGSLSRCLSVAPPVDKVITKRLRKMPKRAKELRQILDCWRKINKKDDAKSSAKNTNPTLCEQIWPKLKLVSTWAHGEAQHSVGGIKEYFPHAVMQPKGLLATEAFISFPLNGEMSALSLNSHFFEFVECGDDLNVLTSGPASQVADNYRCKPDPLLAHEIKLGKKYEVMVTTNGGLYRYRLHDVVEVLGFKNLCPLIRFVGRNNKVVDLFGEKLNEAFVEKVLTTCLGSLPSGLVHAFRMLAPVRSDLRHGYVNGVARNSDLCRPHYILFIELARSGISVRNSAMPISRTDLDDALRYIAQDIDHALMENVHYQYCRKLGQLSGIRVFLVGSSFSEQASASAIYLDHCTKLGQRMGDIKQVALHAFDQWASVFKGRLIF